MRIQESPINIFLVCPSALEQDMSEDQTRLSGWQELFTLIGTSLISPAHCVDFTVVSNMDTEYDLIADNPRWITSIYGIMLIATKKGSLIFFEKAKIWVTVKLLQKEINLCYVKLFKPSFLCIVMEMSWKLCYTEKVSFLFVCFLLVFHTYCSHTVTVETVIILTFTFIIRTSLWPRIHRN